MANLFGANTKRIQQPEKFARPTLLPDRQKRPDLTNHVGLAWLVLKSPILGMVHTRMVLPAPAVERNSSRRDEFRFLLVATAIVAVAALLRCSWPADMEYKADEAWTYHTATRAIETGHLPKYGMPTSQNFLNPGGSVWVFVAIVALFDVQTPVDLVQICQWMNVVAIASLLAFARWSVPIPR